MEESSMDPIILCILMGGSISLSMTSFILSIVAIIGARKWQ